MAMITRAATTPHERMTRARLFAGLDQAEMAALIGRSRNTVSAWERGANEPPLSAVAQWARITGRSLDWIAFGDAEEAPGEPEASRLSHLWDSNPRPIHYE